MNETIRTGLEQVRQRLDRVRRRDNISLFLRRLLMFLALLMAGTLLVAVSEALLHSGTTVRTVLYWILSGSTLILLMIWVLPPLAAAAGLRKGESDFETAGRVGGLIPSIKDHLLNAMQLGQSSSGRDLYSDELTDAAMSDVLQRMKQVDLDAVTDFHSVRHAATRAAIASFVFLLALMLFPGSVGNGLVRVWNHSTDFSVPAGFTIRVEPGNTEVVKGDDVEVTVRVEGTTTEPVRLLARPDGQSEYEPMPLQDETGPVFRHEIQSIRATTRYRAESGPVATEEYTISVIDPPLIRAMRLTVSPPPYSGLAPREQDDHIGDVTGLPGTRVSFRVESSKDLHSARIVYGDSTAHTLDVSGIRAVGTIRLGRTASYRIELMDMDGLSNRDPVEFVLKVVPDEAPRVEIEQPGRDLNVAGNEQLLLVMRLSDDYGFSRLRLAFRLTASRFEQPAERETYVDIDLPNDLKSGGTVSYTWPLEPLSLVPEDAVTYHVEVEDNDRVSGPKLGRSESFLLRLPSLDEIFAKLDEQHDEGREKLEDALQEVEQARKDLRQLEEELQRKQQQADWQEQKRAEQLTERYGDIRKSVTETAELVDEMVKEMEKNTVLSPETLQKYEELQQLLTEMNSPELAEALKRLQEALRQQNPEELLAAMENMKLAEEQFRKSIERTMNLLKRIQIEQKVDEAVRRMDRMTERQEELNRETEAAREADDRKGTEQASEDQMDLAKQMEQMEELLKSLEEMMASYPADMPLEQVDQALAQLDSTALAEQMKELSEQLKNMQMQQATSGQQQTLSSMQQLGDMLKQMQQMMLMNQQQEIVNELRRVYQDLLDLSTRQEEMKNENEGLQGNSPLFRERLAEQMEVLQNLSGVTERLADVSQKSFGVTPDMGKSIGEAMSSMSNAMEALAERDGPNAARMQGGAMESLNEAAQQVQASMQAMMQAGGQGMGMGGLMQQLQSMSEMQQGINQGTRQLGMGQRQGAEMARLAGEQGRARKSLEELAREASKESDLSRLLGDLNETAKEMREVQTDLAGGQIRPETLRRQERILSRLLDSQRSMNERDYEKKRTSETADSYQREHEPGSLSDAQAREQLRRDLLRAMEQGYSTDYESIIRNYFDLLEQSEPPR